MTYKVIVSERRQAFEDLVNSHLKEGWKLQGGVSILERMHSAGFIVYSQAMYMP